MAVDLKARRPTVVEQSRQTKLPVIGKKLSVIGGIRSRPGHTPSEAELLSDPEGAGCCLLLCMDTIVDRRPDAGDGCL